jgi:threonine dehydrogenase-like Zn-dependent dehydrogenase
MHALKLDPALDLIGVPLKPKSVVTKAWEHALYIGRHSAAWQRRIVLITGDGPVGLLAALKGAQYGFENHLFDRAEDGPKRALVRALGTTYHTATLGNLCPDIVIEYTRAASVVVDVVHGTAPTVVDFSV